MAVKAGSQTPALRRWRSPRPSLIAIPPFLAMTRSPLRKTHIVKLRLSRHPDIEDH